MNRNITDTDYCRNNLPENTLQSQGNVRIEFKEDANGEATITQENHYYPYGMRFSGEVFANNDNDFRYNAEKPEISDFIVLDNPEQAMPLLSTKL